MTWTRLDDNWTRDRVIRRLDHQTRWHYLCMIQECSGGKIYDGVLSLADALRCSDADDQNAALTALVDAELVENIDGATFRVVRIKEHVPSPELLVKLEQDRVRAARQRKHKAGDHSDCSPDRCKEAASRDASRQSSRDARDGDGVGTGLAVTGSTSDHPSTQATDEEMWQEVLRLEQEEAS